MLARAFLAQNVAVGASFGGFSIAALPLQEKLHATRGAISLGLALVVLVMGLAGPVVASMLTRLGLRTTMVAGAMLSVLGYLLLANAPNIEIVLAAFGLLIGPGVAMSGPLAASVLASNWFPDAQGRAIGVANVPLLVAIVPLVGQAVIGPRGLQTFFIGLAAMHLALLPLLLGVKDRPQALASADDAQGVAPAANAAALEPPVTVLAQPGFWLMVLGGGVLTATSIIGISQAAALAIERGIASADAALLVSVMGAASIGGSLLSGLVCDRIGGARALGLVGLAFAASWFLLLFATHLAPMMAAMMVVGACGAGVFPCVTVIASGAFGASTLPRALSLYGLFALPLTFLLPPAAGMLRDIAGDYSPVITAVVASCGLVSLVFLLAGRVAQLAAKTS